LKCSYSQNLQIIFMTGLGTQVSQQCFWTAGGPTTLLDWDWATKKFGNEVIQRNVISRLFD